MAINWVTIAITASIGLGGGILSGILASLAGRFSLNRKYENQWADLDQQIEEKCKEQFEKMQSTGSPDERTCFECGKTIQNKAMFCAFCGAPVRGTKMCDGCKKPLPYNAKFCYTCGNEAIDLKEGKKSTPKPAHEPESETELKPEPELEEIPETIKEEPSIADESDEVHEEVIPEEPKIEVDSELTEELDDQEDVDE